MWRTEKDHGATVARACCGVTHFAGALCHVDKERFRQTSGNENVTRAEGLFDEETKRKKEKC